MFEVKTKQFSGPLEKLLELIEEKKLEITMLNLAEVTADFLQYLKTLTNAERTQTNAEISPRLLADFVVVAARLILIKSKALLPSLELSKDEETEIKDLEERLKIYNEFREASRHIKKLVDKDSHSLARPFLISLGDQKFFYPQKDLKLSDLTGAAAKLLAALKELVPEPQKIKTAIVTLSQRVKELLDRLQAASQESFRTMTKGHPRIEVIISFLAILHLLKDRLVHVEQSKQFDDIIIRKSKIETQNQD